MERSPLIPSKWKKDWKKDCVCIHLFFPYIYRLIYIYIIFNIPSFLNSMRFLEFTDFRDFMLNSMFLPWKVWKKGIKGQVCGYKWQQSNIFFPYANGKKELRVKSC